MRFTQLIYRAWMLVLVLIGTASSGMGQRISFGAFAGADITIFSPLGANPELNFSSVKILTPNMQEPIRIGRVEGDPYVVYEIDAAEGFDIMIDVDYGSEIWLDGELGSDNNIDLALRFSYFNRPATDQFTALNGSIEMPPGVRSVIVPVSPRSGGAPGPPPDPFSGNVSSRSKGKVYLFIYGDLGPIGNVQSGRYSGDISITVSYADYGIN
jgi:hypothetical protein